MRILLVEDDSLVSDAISRGLIGSGYVVDAVGDAESVTSRLADTHYDLAIVDLGLPGEEDEFWSWRGDGTSPGLGALAVVAVLAVPTLAGLAEL